MGASRIAGRAGRSSSSVTSPWRWSTPLCSGRPTAAVSCRWCSLCLGAYYAATDGVLSAMASAVLPRADRGSGLGLLATGTSLGRFGASLMFGWIWAVVERDCRADAVCHAAPAGDRGQRPCPRASPAGDNCRMSGRVRAFAVVIALAVGLVAGYAWLTSGRSRPASPLASGADPAATVLARMAAMPAPPFAMVRSLIRGRQPRTGSAWSRCRRRRDRVSSRRSPASACSMHPAAACA